METNIQKQKLSSLIGLSRRAGRLLCGTELTISAVQTGKAKLALLACDASERTKKQLRDKCFSHSVKLVELPLSCDDLARAAGKSAPIAAMAISDKNFAIGIEKLFEAN